MDINDGWIGWLAATLEGEGCINIYPANKNNYAARLSIANTEREFLEAVQQIAGYGTISKSSSQNRKVCYTWFCEKSSEIKRILRMLWPYLIIKKEQAILVIEFCDTVSNKVTPPDILEERKYLMEQIKELNHSSNPPKEID